MSKFYARISIDGYKVRSVGFADRVELTKNLRSYLIPNRFEGEVETISYLYTDRPAGGNDYIKLTKDSIIKIQCFKKYRRSNGHIDHMIFRTYLISIKDSYKITSDMLTASDIGITINNKGTSVSSFDKLEVHDSFCNKSGEKLIVFTASFSRKEIENPLSLMELLKYNLAYDNETYV